MVRICRFFLFFCFFLLYFHFIYTILQILNPLPWQLEGLAPVGDSKFISCKSDRVQVNRQPKSTWEYCPARLISRKKNWSINKTTNRVIRVQALQLTCCREAKNKALCIMRHVVSLAPKECLAWTSLGIIASQVKNFQNVSVVELILFNMAVLMAIIWQIQHEFIRFCLFISVFTTYKF